MPPIEYPNVSKPLTKREVEVIRLIAQGKKPKEIALLLFVEECTVNFHLANIYKKFLVSDKTNAIIRAKEKGIVT